VPKQKRSIRATIFSRVLFPGFLFFAGIQVEKSFAAQPEFLPADSRQLVLVITKNWDGVKGTLQRFEKKSPGDSWKKIGSAIDVVVGRNGLGWGSGLSGEINGVPQKKEGDGKSPAGIFRLSAAFGFAAPNEVHFKLPYRRVTEMLECVDDIHSTHYNSIVDRADFSKPDWNSSEKMRTIDQYQLGVGVDHNTSPRVPGKGSCIFLHIWKGDGSGTSGCTAMKKSNLEKLVGWLDAAADPVLVQLPENEFQLRRREWNLPMLKNQFAK
jgi:D-alanyl-D-alanine dipeptidase